MLLIPHTSRHIAQTRDVNSREINFPGGKQISRAGNKFPRTRSGPESRSTNTLCLSWFPLK